MKATADPAILSHEPQYDETIWDGVEHASARRLLRAALESFAERGYHATTTREISRRANLSPTAMYVYYRSKVDLLVTISEIGHTAVLEAVDEATAEATDPADHVRRFVHAFAAWHARNHTIARVIQYELHSIPADRFDEIRDLRRKADRRLRGALRDGMEESAFSIDSLDLTTLAILSLGIDVARWYDRRPPPETLGAAQADLVMRMIGANEGA